MSQQTQSQTQTKAAKPDPRKAQADTDAKTKAANEAAKKASAAKVEANKKKEEEFRLQKIKLRTEGGKNPKREGTASHSRFALYKNGMTVGQYLAACESAKHNTRAARADISWDVDHKYIELTK